MITRGVASVRSSVKNLQEFNPSVTHDDFVRAVVQAFREEYYVEEPVRPHHKVISFCSTCLSSWPRYITCKRSMLRTYHTSRIAWLNSL